MKKSGKKSEENVVMSQKMGRKKIKAPKETKKMGVALL